MPKYTATFAANVRCYATVEVEAADRDAADRRCQELAAKMNRSEWHWPAAAFDIVFNPEYDTLYDIEYLESSAEESTR